LRRPLVRHAAEPHLQVAKRYRHCHSRWSGSEAAAETELLPTLLRLFASEDGRIGLECFINRTTAEFVGR
jgi:hypothetical protein